MYFVLWILSMFYVWICILNILAIARCNKTDDGVNAFWITLIICIPLLGLLAYWIFGPPIDDETKAEDRKSLESAEASLKERLNRAYDKDAKD